MVLRVEYLPGVEVKAGQFDRRTQWRTPKQNHRKIAESDTNVKSGAEYDGQPAFSASTNSSVRR
jgi:hypothetical protein